MAKTRKDFDLSTADGALAAWRDSRGGIQTEYNDPYASRIGSTIDNLQKNDTFEYNPGSDQSYQILRRQAVNDGRQSMRDTLGRAVGLTSGYNNSYAQVVGQQAYDEKMSKLEAMIPQLRQQAIDNWRADRADKFQQLSALQGESDRGYNRWYGGQQMLRDDANTLLNTWQNNRSFEYQRGRDEVADRQWQQNFDEQRRQFDTSLALDREKAAASAASAAAAAAKNSGSTKEWFEKLGFDSAAEASETFDEWASEGEAKFVQKMRMYGLEDVAQYLYEYYFPKKDGVGQLDAMGFPASILANRLRQ